MAVPIVLAGCVCLSLVSLVGLSLCLVEIRETGRPSLVRGRAHRQGPRTTQTICLFLPKTTATATTTRTREIGIGRGGTTATTPLKWKAHYLQRAKRSWKKQSIYLSRIILHPSNKLRARKGREMFFPPQESQQEQVRHWEEGSGSRL